MGQIRIREEASTPSTPSEGVVVFSTVATPSILKLLDDAGALTTFALLEKTQSFTAAQTIAPTLTGAHAITLNMPVSTSGFAIEGQYNGVERFKLALQSNDTFLSLPSFNNGASFGCRIFVGRNSNGGTPSGGFILLEDSAANFYPLWFDTSGNLRTAGANTQPTSGTTGTVIGTQTSSRLFKNILGAVCSPAESLRNILEAGRKALHKFTYKNGAFNGQEFDGVIVEDAPRYGMDRDEDHPAGKALNEIQLFNDLIQSIVVLNERIERLEHGKDNV